MRKVSNCLAGLLALAFIFSCQSKKTEPTVAKPVLLENRLIRLTKGTDCDKQPDSLRTDCAIIDFSVPKIQETGAPGVIGQNINAWVDRFLIRLLTWTDYNEPGKEPPTVDAAIQRFRAIHDENAGAVSSGMFKATCSGSELLNDGNYLTLMLDGFSFQGGNRALTEVAIATFDIKTGRQLTLDDLVHDKAGLLPLAQATVRETRATAFREGFEFDPNQPFVLPASFGLRPDGLIFHYQPGEIYRLGGPTEFVVPYSELGSNLKIAPPAPLAVGSGSVAWQDIYESQGSELVIPTFEIEVDNSATATKTLARKKESIIVSAMFWTEPIDPNEKAKGQDGLISVVNKNIELTGNNRIARFEGLKFDKSLLGKMEDKDISLLINIYSGRKSSPDNLLDCGILEIKASQLANKRFTLGCQLIEETPTGAASLSSLPAACYVLPEGGAAPKKPLNFLVDCTESGELQFAGTPVKNYEALMATLRPLLTKMIKDGRKAAELPGIETQGCMMGNSGAIRDYYDELKAELTGKRHRNDAKTEKTDRKTTTGKKGNADRPAGTKSLSAKSGTPTVTLRQNGDMFVNGKAVSDLESLRKVLQEALLNTTVIPDKLNLTTVGTTGMGMRAEMNTIIAESIAGAKWVRKKNAIATLNTSVGKKLGITTQLEPGDYQTSGNFAYISAKPRQANGKVIDYSKTTYAAAAAADNFADNTIGLLQYEKGAWKILIYSIGVSKPPANIWMKKYKAPKVLFRNTAG